jgi:hypothetical protein
VRPSWIRPDLPDDAGIETGDGVTDPDHKAGDAVGGEALTAFERVVPRLVFLFVAVIVVLSVLFTLLRRWKAI